MFVWQVKHVKHKHPVSSGVFLWLCRCSAETQDCSISRSINVIILLICASVINSIFTADTASISLIKTTELIHSWLQTANLECAGSIDAKVWSLINLQVYNMSVTMTMRQKTETVLVSGWYLILGPTGLAIQLEEEKWERQRHTKKHTHPLPHTRTHTRGE